MIKLTHILSSFLFTVLLLAVACTSKTTDNTSTDNEEQLVAHRVSEPGLAASCPYLTKDHHGNIVLSWVQATDTTGNHLLAYAVSEDGGKTFGTTRTIPTTQGVYPHDENLSKLLFRKNGDMIAMFAVSNPNEKNAYAGLVYYTQSFDNGKSWTTPKQLAENTVNSIDERYFDLELLPNDEVAAIWLDSRKNTDKEGSSLYFASTRGRDGFVGEKVIDTQLCQCCRTDLYLDGQQKLHVAYRGIMNDSIRDMMYMVSGDNGKSFSKPERISADNWVIQGCPHTGPAMTSNQNGLHYAWFTMGGGSGVYYSLKQPGKAFTPRQSVSNAPAAKHPQMTAFGTGNLAITWDERNQQTEVISSHIGLQIRNEKGEHLRTNYLTPDSINAVYPVIMPANSEYLLVAYTVKREGPGEVWYQLVSGKRTR
ncbi:sialidase family protein [Pontibacter sp. MBLB2868]|uniref:sialidase family protein n=1 Tax=Pontibacter sp. MBLB2868 TaxID=3451555 RepID=UPI003F74C538